MTEEALDSNRHYREGAKQYIARSYTHVIADFTVIRISGETFRGSGSENVSARVHQLPELSSKASCRLSYVRLYTKFPFAPHKEQNMQPLEIYEG
jgi:hypothetical protein